MSNDALLVTAHLASPLAGDSPPRLDGLLEYALSLHHQNGLPGHKITRDGPAPEPGAIPIPILRCRLGGFLIGCCSDAILESPTTDDVEFINKRIDVNYAAMLAPSSRLVVSTTNSWTKSYRIPLRMRTVGRIAWFARGDRRGVRKTLKQIPALGKKLSVGYGRVREWTVDRVNRDYSWFAPSPDGPVLMATLPKGDWLPRGLIGYREDFKGVAPPYWHLSRRCEVVVPA